MTCLFFNEGQNFFGLTVKKGFFSIGNFETGQYDPCFSKKIAKGGDFTQLAVMPEECGLKSTPCGLHGRGVCRGLKILKARHCGLYL